MSTFHRTLWAAGMLLASTALFVPVSWAQAEGAGAPSEPTKAQRYYISGTELMNNYRYLDAVEQFNLAIDEDSDYVDAYKSLAYVYTKMAESEPVYYEDALDTYIELEDLVPEDVEVKKFKAFVQAALSDLDDAVATYEDILELTPEDCDAWGRLGELRQSLAEQSEKGSPEYMAGIEEAVDAYKKITEFCPENGQAYNKLGEIYYAAERTEEASAVYEELLSRDPENVDITGRLGYLWYSAAKKAEEAKNEEQAKTYYKNAEPRFAKLLELDPTRTNYRKLYAETLKKTGKFSASVDEYLKIIEASPDEKGLYCNCGFILAYDAKDGEKAIDLAMKAIGENAPEPGCLYFVWGKGLELRGNDQVQKFEFDRAISTYTESKTKFTLAQGDKKFGDSATKQLSRIDQLVERAKALKLKYLEETKK